MTFGFETFSFRGLKVQNRRSSHFADRNHWAEDRPSAAVPSTAKPQAMKLGSLHSASFVPLPRWLKKVFSALKIPGSERHNDREAAAFSHFTLNIDCAALQLNDLPGQI